ncbi:MAG: hypothetical protein ABIQ86_07380 [Steroidobacteraceae bacterium]
MRQSLSAFLLPFIPVAALAAHSWCGSVEPGKGLLLQRLGEKDRMCGWIQAQYDGAHRFTASVPGSRVWIARQLVTGPTMLKAESYYAIVIETPKSEDFRLSWDQPLGVPMEIPPFVLFKPAPRADQECLLPGEEKF